MSEERDDRDPDDIELTAAQRAEAERRLLAHEANPGQYPTWEEIKRRLMGRR